MTDSANPPITPPNPIHDAELSGARKLAAVLFVIGAAAIGGFSFYLIFDLARHRPDFYAISVQHFAAVIGLPLSAILSLFVVLLFRVVSGEKLHVNILGIKFEGASGPVIMWVICFLSIALSISALWDKKYTGPVSELFERLVPQQASPAHAASAAR